MGSGNLVTRQVEESDFTAVEAGSALKVDLAQSATYGVSVTADDNVIDYVEVSKVGTALRLGMKSGSYNNATIRVLVTMPDLKSIRFSGASKGTMVGFKPQSLEARLSGASQLTGRLEAGSLDLSVAEASNLNLGGSADSLKLSGSGSSQTSLGDLAVSSATINLREASTATVNVRNKLDADLRSASNLYYVGTPTLGNITSLEASSVRRR